MRSVDLAAYADCLAAEAGAVASRLERARTRFCQAAIEHEARHALPAATARTLERMGVLGANAAAADASEIEELAAELAAVERLQAWVESRLSEYHSARVPAGGSGDRRTSIGGEEVVATVGD